MTNDLERMLAETLRENAGDAPMPGAVPMETLRKARQRRLAVAGGSVLSAAAVIAAIAVTSQAILAGPEPAPAHTEPPAPLPSPVVSTTTEPTTQASPSPSPSPTASEEPLATPTLPPVTATVPEAVTNDEQPNPSGDDWNSVDCQNPCVQRIVEIDERVVDITPGPRDVDTAGGWVLTENAVILYDAGTLLERVEIPNYSGKPTSITASREYVYVAAGSHLFRITPRDLKVESGCFCYEGRVLREVIFGSGHLWISYMDEAGGGVSRLSETGDNATFWYDEQPIALPSPSAIAVTARYAWVVSGSALRRIEVETAQLAGGIETGFAGPRPLIAVGTSIWTQLSGHTVEIVSDTGVVKAAYPVLGLLNGQGDFLMVTDADERTVYRIVPETGEIDHALLIDAAPQVVARGGWTLLAESDAQGSSRVIQIEPGH